MKFQTPALGILALGLPSTVLAQADRPIPADQAIPISISQIRGGGYDRSYGHRIDEEVYQVGLPSETGGDFRLSGTNVYDDVNFAGPYTSNNRPLVLNGMGIGFNLPATFPSPNGDHMYTRVSFYPNHTGDATPVGANPYNGTPIVATLDWGAGWTTGASPGSVRYLGQSMTFAATIATLTNADVFNGGPTDRLAGVKIETFADAAYTVRPTDWAPARRGLFNYCKVGSTDPYGWLSNTAIVATGEIPNSTDGSTRTGGAGNNRGTFMGFQGTGFYTDGYCLSGFPCHISASIPCMLSDNSVAWTSFCVNVDATDDTLHFMDLDCEGSLPDIALAIYDGNSTSPNFGNLIAVDTDSGSGTQPMLSFGIGRRPAVGDGRQYDGRNHYGAARGLPAGTCYAAVAPNNSTFADGFSVNAIGPGGPFYINIHSNLDGSPLAPSVRPLPDLNLGAATGDTPIPAADLAPSSVRWVHFQTCLGASPSRPVSIDLSGTTSSDSSLTLFDSAGNLVAQAIAPSGPPAALTFSSPGSLPAGHYDLAISRAAVQLAPNPAQAGRWHIRAVSGANLDTFQGAVHVAWSTCCGTNDFNGDGNVGTDADIEAFFACLAGSCCPTCATADFNGDGDTGTDSDIESFFRVLAGSPC